MASKYLESVPLPAELPVILDALVKAILRDQPPNILHYCTTYF